LCICPKRPGQWLGGDYLVKVAQRESKGNAFVTMKA